METRLISWYLNPETVKGTLLVDGIDGDGKTGSLSSRIRGHQLLCRGDAIRPAMCHSHSRRQTVTAACQN